MIRALYRSRDGHLQADLTPEAYGDHLKDEAGLVWVDILHDAGEDSRTILLETFGFHPLAVDDALEEIHVPKVDDWGDYLYLVLHESVMDGGQSELVTTQELDIFLGRNYLVTYRTRAIAGVDRVWDLVQRDERQMRKGAAYLLYLVADELVADYMPLVEKLDEMIDEVEDRVFDRPGPSLVERIFALKRALLRLRRIIAPQREVLNKLARGDYPTLQPEDRVYFRDVYDHLVRLHDISEGLRDLVTGSLDTYLSVVSNRMNEIMKTLTLITTLFMPISFLAGFFGMNFFQPVFASSGWTGLPAFGVVLAAMVLFPLGMYLWMRRRAWM